MRPGFSGGPPYADGDITLDSGLTERIPVHLYAELAPPVHVPRDPVFLGEVMSPDALWRIVTSALETALTSESLLDGAKQLFARAVADGWAADGADGFVYTTDWDGTPSSHARMFWVLTEAIGAAWALHHVDGSAQWRPLVEKWWAYAKAYLLDLDRGAWHSELDATNAPYAGTWVGKPDTYHAIQAMLLPRLPLTPSFTTALAARGAIAVLCPRSLRLRR